MRAFMFFVIGIAAVFIWRGCNDERYRQICAKTCIMMGYEMGRMPSTWECHCEGFKKRKRPIVIP